MQDHRHQDRHDSHEVLGARVQAVLKGLLEQPPTPGLYLVATPIGNLGDISLRALAVLATADLIAAEDTRHSRKLLTHFGIGAELTPYHEHNAAKERPRLIARIKAGQSVALISDAGTPLISDPGYKLVREALAEGLLVSSIPGPSAVLAGLTSAGLPTDAFFFAGFLPPKSGPRRARLEQVASIPATLIFFETAPRLGRALTDMAEVLGSREAVLAKELTKLHETLTSGRLDRLAQEFATGDEPKGEFVVIVGPPPDAAEASDEAIIAELERALANDSTLRDAVRDVAQELRVKRTRVYALGLELERQRGGA